MSQLSIQVSVQPRNGMVQRLVGSGSPLVQGHHFLVVDELPGEPGAIPEQSGRSHTETVGRARMDADREVRVRICVIEIRARSRNRYSLVARWWRPRLGRLAADGDGFPVGIAFLEFIARGVDVPRSMEPCR